MIKGSCLCGGLSWTFEGPVESVTACNCTACRRYGTLWAYGYENREIKVTGQSTTYCRPHKKPALHFHFCPTCGCTTHYIGTKVEDDGTRRGAVNLRQAEQPDAIQHLLIDHFDGLTTFDDLPRDGRCVRDLWF